MTEPEQKILNRQTGISLGLAVAVVGFVLSIYLWSAGKLEASSERTGVRIERMSDETGRRLDALRSELGEIKAQLALAARTRVDVDGLARELGAHKQGRHSACTAKMAELEVRIATLDERLRALDSRLSGRSKQ